MRLNEKSYRLLLARVRKLTSRAFNSFFEKISTGTGRPTILKNSSASFFFERISTTTRQYISKGVHGILAFQYFSMVIRRDDDDDDDVDEVIIEFVQSTDFSGSEIG